MATLYTTLDADQQPLNLIVGQAFTTYWMKIQTPEDAAWSLTAVGSLYAMVATHPAQCLTAWGAADRDRWCVEVQTVDDPAPTLDDLKTQALADAGVEYDARRTSPFPWDFGATEALDDLGASVGAAGSQTLQMRESPRDDLKNWLAVQAGATVAMIGGASTSVIPIKVTSNVWVQTTAADLVAVLVAGDGAQMSALQRGSAQLARFGAIKADILAATTTEELAAARAAITEDWPA